MEAHQVLLNSFLSQTKTQFVIPVNQRNYDWTEHQCKQLFKDIIEVGKLQGKSHFVGSIVFIHDGVYTSTEVKPLVVIDGQQRLTTISLLYLALYKFAMTNGMEEKANEINETYLVNKFVKEDSSKLKLKQTDMNAKAFKFLLSANDASGYGEYSKVIENYKIFTGNITADNFEFILNGLNSLLFVEISLERGKDDPQRIFESLNSTGLELSQADLIRNYILMGLEPKEQVRIFEEYWEVIENNAKDKEKEESRVSDFSRDYLTLKNKKIPNKNKVYEEFKSIFADRNKTFYDINLKEIRDFSYHYNKLINPINEPDLDLQRELNYINRLEMNVSFPFLIPVYEDYKNNIISMEEFLKVLKLTQSYAWRRFIVNLQTNALNKIFMTLYGDIQKSNYIESLERALVKKKGIQRYPNNAEIESALAEKDMYNIQSKNRLYFLELLENYNNREYVSVDNPDITIEHIFPQKPDAKWRDFLSAEDYATIKDKFLNTIANLTLSGNNGSLGNKTFLEKKNMNTDDKQQGYKFSRLWLNHYLKELEKWDLETLKARYSLLLDRFFEVWDYPNVEIIAEDETDQEYTIYSSPDPTGKKLRYFIFKDEKIVEKEISKMYYHVLRSLLEAKPNVILSPDLKNSIQISSNPLDLRMPYKISDNYYAEANLGNDSKFKRLKSALTKCDCEDELLIAFAK